jgi:hypothetical protein
VSDEPTIEGGLERNAVLHVVRTKAVPLQRCYDRLAKADPDGADTRTSVRFTIARAGEVSDVTLGTAVEAKFDACITKVFRALKFTGATGPVVVNYPLVFRPQAIARDVRAVRLEQPPASDLRSAR